MKNLLIILFLPLFASCQKITIQVSKKVQLANIINLPMEIKYFGDSFTLGAPSDGGSTYPFKLFVTYPSIPKTVYAVGGTKVCGLTYAPTGGNDLIDLYQTEINLGYTGQLVSFCYGTNDAGTGGLINASWKAAYKTIIQAFITAGWPLDRLLIMIPPSKSTVAAGGATMRQIISEIASETGIMVYDVYQTFLDTGINDSFFDGTNHPYNAAHVVWASSYDHFLRR